MVRVMGLKPEKTYGKLDKRVINPDFHRELESGSFKLNDEVVTANVGSRMTQLARAGRIAPTGESEGKSDLKRIGHYFYAALDQYNFYEKANEYEEFKDLEDTYHIHEFYGGEDSLLHSFTGWVTFDLFMKKIFGLLLNNLKLEVSDEFMSQSEEWVYKTEEHLKLDQDKYEKLIPCGAIPIMSYDISCRLGKAVETGEDTHNFTSLSFELNNNIDSDNTGGLGSRFPKRQASAKERELTVELKGNLTPEDLELIRGSEYGDTELISPSECKIYRTSVQFIVKICEKKEETLIVTLPYCTVNVEYDMSESDEIETTFILKSLGSRKATLMNGKSRYTDIHAVLVNDVRKISAELTEDDLNNRASATVTFKDSKSSIITDTVINYHLTGVNDSLELKGSNKVGEQASFSCDDFTIGNEYILKATSLDYDDYVETFEFTEDMKQIDITLADKTIVDCIGVFKDKTTLKPIEQMDIEVLDSNAKKVINELTDCYGRVTFSKLKKGETYTVKTDLKGYKPTSIEYTAPNTAEKKEFLIDKEETVKTATLTVSANEKGKDTKFKDGVSVDVLLKGSSDSPTRYNITNYSILVKDLLIGSTYSFTINKEGYKEYKEDIIIEKSINKTFELEKEEETTKLKK